MRRMLIVLCVVSGLATSCSGSTDNLFGEELFANSCARCHGAHGAGGVGPAIDVGSEVDTAFTDEQIIGTIQAGPGVMPSFTRFSDAQLDSLVAFIRSLD